VSDIIITPGPTDQEIVVTGDSNLVAGNINKDVQIFEGTGTYEGGSASFVLVLQTGQTTSYGDRDDGDLEKGVAWPNPRFTDNNGDGTVSDNLTGLIWLKKANNGTMTWNDALAFANNLASGNSGLTDGSQAGDWRLPNRFELESLLDLQYANPALSNTAGTGQWRSGDPFSGVRSSFYWSSSTNSYSTTYGWYVNLNNGNVNRCSKGNRYLVWPVRSGQ